MNKDIEVVWVDISTLKAHPKNPNKHPPEQIERLAKILKYQGFRSPIVVSELTGFVTVGHGRIEAAKLNGWTKVPVSVQQYEDEAQEYAHMTSDNAIAEWADLDLSQINAEMLDLGPDFDVDLLGLKDFEIEPLDKLDGASDEAPPLPVEPKSKLGDLWTLGKHRLLCGDSTSIDAVERLMDGAKADMVFTDPPYGIAVENGQGSILNDEDLQTFKDVLPILKAFTHEDGHFYVWCAAGDLLPESIWEFSKNIEFKNLLPIRCTHENKRCPKGSFKYNYEVCLFGNNNKRGFNESKKFKVSATTLNDDRYSGSGFLKVYPALWDGERSTEHNMNIVHPTQKKVEMIEFYLEISSKKGELVMELFGGSGSTLIACEKQGRTCYAMELDPKYVDVILARWAKHTGKDPVRDDGVTWSQLTNIKGD